MEIRLGELGAQPLRPDGESRLGGSQRLVDPVPGEVLDQHGRQAGRPGDIQAERRDVGDHAGSARSGDGRRDLAGPEALRGAPEARERRQGGGQIFLDRTLLDQADVAGELPAPEGDGEGLVEKPLRNRRPELDLDLRQPAAEGLDELLAKGRYAEAAQLALKHDRFADAVDLYLRGNDPARAAQVAARSGDHRQAAELYELSLIHI